MFNPLEKNFKVIIYYLILISLTLIPTFAFGAEADNIEKEFKIIFTGYKVYLDNLAQTIFWLLVTIDFVLLFGRLIFGQADFQAFASTLMFQIITIGFLWWLVQNASSHASGTIIKGFQQAATGTTYGTVATTPDQLYTMGLSIGAAIIDNKTTVWGILTTNVMYVLIALAVILSFVYLSAKLLLVYIEASLYTYGGLILVGFIGSRFTRDIGLNYFKLMFAVGMKLFVMIMLYGGLTTFLSHWVGGAGAGSIDPTVVQREQSLLTLLTVLFIFIVLIQNIPEYIQGLISGITFSSGEGLAKTAQSISKGVQNGMKAAGAVATGGAGAAALVSETGKAIASADKQVKSGGGGFVSRGVTAAATAMTAPIKGVAKVATEEAKNNLRGNVAGRTAAAMEETRLGSKVDSKKPDNVITDDKSNGESSSNNKYGGMQVSMNYSTSANYENNEYGEDDLKDEK